jgi:mono/diheme cytochrome c family protein
MLPLSVSLNIASNCSWAEEATFFIKTPDQSLTFKQSALLSHKATQTITVEQDPAYHGSTREYRAVPLSVLFQNAAIAENATLQFECQDGFSAPIEFKKLIETRPGNSLAYLAVEPMDKTWPPLKPGESQTAGPFYLVWLNPKLSDIKREEWPYALAGFKVTRSIGELYPAIVPRRGKYSQADPIGRGFEVFTKNCFTCHTMNLQGSSQMGPDLNVPMNPTQYFTTQALRTLIRNPQDLHFWPQSKMHGFSVTELSDAELNDLLDYLKAMSHQKVPGNKQ